MCARGQSHPAAKDRRWLARGNRVDVRNGTMGDCVALGVCKCPAGGKENAQRSDRHARQAGRQASRKKGRKKERKEGRKEDRGNRQAGRQGGKQAEEEVEKQTGRQARRQADRRMESLRKAERHTG